MGFPQSTRAYADLTHPEPWAICDRCGFRYLHRQLNWQFDWRGNQLANLRILVCGPCTDVPFDQDRPIIIGPDPIPVKDPRGGWYATQMGPPPSAPAAFSEYIIDDGSGEPIIDDGTGLPISDDGASVSHYMRDDDGNVITDDGTGLPIIDDGAIVSHYMRDGPIVSHYMRDDDGNVITDDTGNAFRVDG